MKMLTEMIEYGHKIEKEVQAMQSEIKIYTGNQQWREGNWDSNQRIGTVGRNKHLIGTEWRDKNSKNEERLRNLWDNFNPSNIWVMGVPEGEEEAQEIENLVEQKMKENFPNLAKEIDFQEVQEIREPQRRWTQGSTHQGTS